MNSTKILFLKMLRGDIKRKAYEKMGIDPSQMSNEREGLLTGQTIAKSDIEAFSSYKLMNDEERTIVDSVLNSLNNKESEVGSSRGRTLSKQIDSLIPTSTADAIEYKDVA